ncbi:MAG: hypothetical protein ACLFNO_03555 [Parcubacteria group bacterium]
MFQKNAKTILLSLVVILLIGIGAYLIMSQSTESNLNNYENTVGDQNGEETELEDNDSETNSDEERRHVISFLESNISDLSPEEAVLGGTFYVTDVYFPEENKAIVNYEDGHIALMAEVEYLYDNEEVEIESFEVIENNEVDENRVDLEEGASDGSEEEAVINYLENNISDLSPEEPVLGGSFYIVNVIFPEQNLAIVDYEDGHIALTGKLDYSITANNQVEVNSFELIPEGSTLERNEDSDGDICVDMCGDGVCQEIVCMGEGCPCPETAENCPADCS